MKKIKPVKMTICFLVKDGMVCLAEKKRGFRRGKLNGYGGKAEKGEGIRQCALRETWEESTVNPKKIKKQAKISFITPFEIFECHSYVIDKWEGDPTETEEMKPDWYSLSCIPFERMGVADAIWVPLVLEGKKVIADFFYDENSVMIGQDVRVVAKF